MSQEDSFLREFCLSLPMERTRGGLAWHSHAMAHSARAGMCKAASPHRHMLSGLTLITGATPDHTHTDTATCEQRGLVTPRQIRSLNPYSAA